jgi:isopentenyl-diphosphate delta-isomerase
MEHIEKRKLEHVEHALDDYTEGEGAGWDCVRLPYYALPEADYSTVDCSIEFLGKNLALPFMVTAITGGWQGGRKINLDLAKACEECGVAFGLGSQRAMIENPKLAETFQVREVAPKTFIAGNIGAFQLKEYGPEKVAEAIDAIEADALCVHLNPLQEAIQPEGDKDWRNCLKAIQGACKQLKKPVIAKEVGAGVNGEVAKELVKAGVSAIDLAGKGGTSFAAIEAMRGGSNAFNDYGLSTVESLLECKGAGVPLIASGGVRNGVHAAKALFLGATLAGAARPFVKAQQEGGSEAVSKLIRAWGNELKTALFLARKNRI